MRLWVRLLGGAVGSPHTQGLSGPVLPTVPAACGIKEELGWSQRVPLVNVEALADHEPLSGTGGQT